MSIDTIDSFLNDFTESFVDDWCHHDSEKVDNSKIQGKKAFVAGNYIPLKRGRLPRSSLPFRAFVEFPSILTDSFNSGNIYKLASDIESVMHPRCLFRQLYNKNTSQFVGPGSIIYFFDNLLCSFPDGYIQLKRMKSFPSNKFQVIRSKFVFIGSLTEKVVNCPLIGGSEVDLIPSVKLSSVYGTSSTPSAPRKRLIVKTVLSLFIDSSSNRIVLVDERYDVKFSSQCQGEAIGSQIPPINQ